MMQQEGLWPPEVEEVEGWSFHVDNFGFVEIRVDYVLFLICVALMGAGLGVLLAMVTLF